MEVLWSCCAGRSRAGAVSVTGLLELLRARKEQQSSLLFNECSNRVRRDTFYSGRRDTRTKNSRRRAPRSWELVLLLSLFKAVYRTTVARVTRGRGCAVGQGIVMVGEVAESRYLYRFEGDYQVRRFVGYVQLLDVKREIAEEVEGCGSGLARSSAHGSTTRPTRIKARRRAWNGAGREVKENAMINQPK
jgi:hypothetical protein